MNLRNFCLCSKSCLFLFALINIVFCEETLSSKSNGNKAYNEEVSGVSQPVPFVIPSSRYNTLNQEKKMANNAFLSLLEEKLLKNNYKSSEALERLRRSSYLPFEALSGTPSRRSSSHPCRWKLCGAHFGYHSMRRF